MYDTCVCRWLAAVGSALDKLVEGECVVLEVFRDEVHAVVRRHVYAHFLIASLANKMLGCPQINTWAQRQPPKKSWFLRLGNFILKMLCRAPLHEANRPPFSSRHACRCCRSMDAVLQR